MTSPRLSVDEGHVPYRREKVNMAVKGGGLRVSTGNSVLGMVRGCHESRNPGCHRENEPHWALSRENPVQGTEEFLED